MCVCGCVRAVPKLVFDTTFVVLRPFRSLEAQAETQAQPQTPEQTQTAKAPTPPKEQSIDPALASSTEIPSLKDTLRYASHYLSQYKEETQLSKTEGGGGAPAVMTVILGS